MRDRRPPNRMDHPPCRCATSIVARERSAKEAVSKVESLGPLFERAASCGPLGSPSPVTIPWETDLSVERLNLSTCNVPTFNHPNPPTVR